MAKAIWIVYEAGYENGDILYGIFSTRRKMLTAIEKEFEELNMRWYNGKPMWGQFRRNGYVHNLAFNRVKLDKWMELQ